MWMCEIEQGPAAYQQLSVIPKFISTWDYKSSSAISLTCVIL